MVRSYVHIVDFDCARRAQIARELYEQAIHAEIYETLDELIDSAPSRGCVLINADRPSVDEEDAVERIAARIGHLPVAFFSASPQADRIVKAVLAGALDYLQWPGAEGALKKRIEQLAEAGCEKARTEQRRREAQRRIAALSPREREVLRGVIEGGSNKQIALALGISPRTVEIHRGNMMTRLHARSAAEAVRIGIQGGLADSIPPSRPAWDVAA